MPMKKFHALNSLEISMVRRPDTSHTFVQTRDRLLGSLQFLSAGFLEQVGLLKDLLRLQVPHTNRLLSTIDVMALDDGMLVWSWGDPDLDLWVGLCKGGEGVFQEGPIASALSGSATIIKKNMYMKLTASPASYQPSRSNGSRGVCIAG